MSENIQNQNQQPQQRQYIPAAEGTKKCKHCKSDIPTDAKVCPYCRKKQGGKIKTVIIAVVVVFVLAGIYGSQKKNDQPTLVSSTPSTSSAADNDTTPSTISASPEPSSESITSSESAPSESSDSPIFHVGETAEYENVKVTFVNVTESYGTTIITPTDGNTFIYAEFEIENDSAEELTISSFMSFDGYYDGYSTDASFSATAATDMKSLDGTIAPGKKMKGCVAFEIPSDYAELEIHLALDFWTDTKIVFLYEK